MKPKTPRKAQKRSRVSARPAISSKKDIRCIECRTEFAEKELGEVDCCPKCKTKTLPCYTKHDIKVDINWAELRTLAIWAANFAKTLGPEAMFAVECIINQLRKFKPEGAPGLTLVDELNDIAKELGIEIEIVEEGKGITAIEKKVPTGSKLVN